MGINNKQIFKNLIYLALPAMIEEMLSTLLLYVDTAMVGHLGEKATAAVSCTTTVTWLMSCVPYAISTAFLALISRACGAGDEKECRKLSGQAFSLSIIAGVFMTILCCALSPFIPIWMRAESDVIPNASAYFFIVSLSFVFRTLNRTYGGALRAIKDTKTPMLINVGENILNLILNAFFMYGLHMGVKGAALGSMISYTIFGVAMLYAARKHNLLRFNRHDIKLQSKYVRSCVDIGLPAMMTSVASCFGYVVFAGMVSGMGTTVFAAHSIAVTAEQMFYIPGYGLRVATSSLVGNAIGEGDNKKRTIIERQSIAVSVGMMAVTGCILYFVALPLMKIFTPVEDVARIGSEMLKLVAFTEPFYGLMIVVEGIFYGAGITKPIFAIETFSMWGIRILSTFFVTCVWFLSLREVWYCMIADNLFKAIGLFAVYLFIKRREKMKKPSLLL